MGGEAIYFSVLRHDDNFIESMVSRKVESIEPFFYIAKVQALRVHKYNKN